MHQSFDERADRSFGSKHVPLIRRAMAAQGLYGFLVPHEDEYQNEYLPAANERLAWATGFTGSAGAALILEDKAAIFVDGRYALQVRQQVDEAVFEVRDLVDAGVLAYIESQVCAGKTLGYDPRLHTLEALEQLRAAAAKASATLRAVEVNPLDLAWGLERPSQPGESVVPHPLEFAGEDSRAKRARIAAALTACGADAALLTAPASIAWLFNIRGRDVIHSPLPLGQAILKADGSALLFLDSAKISPLLVEWLGEDVKLERPDSLGGRLAELRGQQVLLDTAQSSAWYFDALIAADVNVIVKADPCVLARACKNATEIDGARRAHRRDGAALTRFLYWLETDAVTSLPDEVAIAVKLEGFREATGVLRDLSFDSIVGAGLHGAVVHYRPTRRSARRIELGSLLLVDSGAQYQDGTTDVTRTIAIGEPTTEMRRRFTLVLKGHLSLARVRFPEGTTGSALDALARVALWSAGLDYDHGTGHGVGSYLGVHEGPQGFSKRPNAAALRPGMIISNEPGYYKEGDYGIRIENLQVVIGPAPIEGGERPMLGFETLTLAPIDRNLIEGSLLTPEEALQLDAYHARVSAEIGPLLPAAEREWLQGVCAPIR